MNQEVNKPADMESLRQHPEYHMQRIFWELDTLLHNHEAPFYRACAGGPHFEISDKWKQEREKLRRAWDALHYRTIDSPSWSSKDWWAGRKNGMWNGFLVGCCLTAVVFSAISALLS